MDLVFDIATSVEFWRRLYPPDRAPSNFAASLPAEPVCKGGAVRDLAPPWAESLRDGEGRLHVLSFGRADGRCSRQHVSHSWSGPVPEGSFYERSPHVFVESPEFMFLHAATILGFYELIAFGDELCGLYSFDPREERGFRNRRVPLTSVEKLRRFLCGAANCKGRKAALRALPFVIERSASPMETFDEMAMCLPYRYGGYNIPAPSMNQEVQLTPRARQVARRLTCRLDLGYLERGLDVEHHGKLDHSSPEDRESDAERVNGLREMGVEVIELTAKTVFDLSAHEIVVQRIAKILGKRLLKEKLGPLPERVALRRSVKEWNLSSGKVR